MLGNQIAEIQKDVLLSEKTKCGYGIGGTADYYVSVRNVQDIEFCLNFAKTKEIPYFILGKGSNILVSDSGFRGIVISTQRMDSVRVLSKHTIRAEAGVTVCELVREGVQEKLPGIEELSGIPGTVGGAIVMNASAYSQSISDHISQICFYDCKLSMETVISKEKAKFGYRTSVFKEKNGIVLWADFVFPMETKYGILAARQNEVLRKRKEKQPLEYHSCGSCFKNPPDGYAAKLIDEAGLKGFCIGDAQVSEKHANFIVNKGNASAEDVRKVMAHVRNTVNEKYGVFLQPEVLFLGEFETEF